MANGHKLPETFCARHDSVLTNIETAGLSDICASCLASPARVVVALVDVLPHTTVLGGMRRSFELYFRPWNSGPIVC